jgi:hypothetical protein
MRDLSIEQLQFCILDFGPTRNPKSEKQRFAKGDINTFPCDLRYTGFHGQLLMSSLFRDYVASVRPRGEPCRSRSMVLCLAGHHPVLSIGGNARRQGLKTTSALLCARSPGLTPRSLFGYSIVDSLIIRPLDPQYPSPPLTTPTLLVHLIKSPRRVFGEFPSPA